jgi:parallel beta-helix repeat protein
MLKGNQKGGTMNNPSVSRHTRGLSLLTYPALLLVLSLAACSPDQNRERPIAQDRNLVADPVQELQLRFLEASPGDIIRLPAGTFSFERSLTLNVDGVTLRGAGMNSTILSFRDQVAGAEGLLVNASDFTIEDIGIEDTRGDALKIARGTNIVIRRVRTEWTNGPATENGAYGIYPVQTENTLIEESVAIGASDAGIYVGQSRNVVVRGNRAEYNVAGIEIENTVGADVYNNIAMHNTGGILVFNMPNLSMEGHSTRVFRNQITANNTENFAPPGTAVSSVPSGSGVIINSNDKVEIFDNDIAGNDTAGILISSYFSAGYSSRQMGEAFDPYPETIYIYNNRYGATGASPGRPELNQLRIAMFGETGRLPEILWDGVTHPDRTGERFRICVEEPNARLLNIDAANEGANPRIDMEAHACSHEKLPSIRL